MRPRADYSVRRTMMDGGRAVLGDGGPLWTPESPVVEESTHTSPERRLLAAVLEQATRDYQKPAEDARGRHLWRPAPAWFADDDLTWPCAFAAICQTLGISKEWARRRLGKTMRGHRHLHALPPPQSRPKVKA